jgi:molecular chaperone DnaJ
MKRDYYEVLGIEKEADAATIKSAYRKLARQYHPDINKNEGAEDQFKEIAEAYEVLSDTQKRTIYDRYGHNVPGGGSGEGFEGFGGFSDIFDMFFGGASGSSARRSGPQRGADLRYDLTLTLEEAFKGLEKHITFPRIENCETCNGSGAATGTKPDTCVQCGGTGQMRRTQQSIFGMVQQLLPCDRCGGRGQIIRTPCSTCGGKGRTRKSREVTVTVPAGVDTGMQLPLRGEGEGGVLGGPPGDLYIFFNVQEHPRYEREGLHLYTEIPISFVQAALGDELLVRTMGGEEVAVAVGEGTQTGTQFTLRGQGMPDVRSSVRRGDLHVQVRVEVPRNLTEEQKRLLREFAQQRGEKPVQEKPKGLFERVKEAFTGE